MTSPVTGGNMNIQILYWAASLIIVGVPVPHVSNNSSTFDWNDHVRPPVSLEKAIELSREQLGDDYANRYCVRVSLYGNPTGGPKPGQWNLFYAAENGSKKHVIVDMDGNAAAGVWNQAIDWNQNKGKRADLADIKKRLQIFFDKERLGVEFSESNGKVVVTHRTRMFQVHQLMEDGRFDDQLTELRGPASDGFIIEYYLTNKPVSASYENGIYWSVFAKTVPLQTKDNYVHFSITEGRRIKREYVLQLIQIFGTIESK